MVVDAGNAPEASAQCSFRVVLMIFGSSKERHYAGASNSTDRPTEGFHVRDDLRQRTTNEFTQGPPRREISSASTGPTRSAKITLTSRRSSLVVAG